MHINIHVKRLRIYGCGYDKELHTTIHTASHCFIKWLIPYKQKYDITISLYEGLIESDGAFGECWANSAHSFRIRAEKQLSTKTLITTLAHEFVHLKQFAKGELKFLSKYDIWNGKVYYHDTSYEMAPWEKEACELEDGLYKRYMNIL